MRMRMLLPICPTLVAAAQAPLTGEAFRLAEQAYTLQRQGDMAGALRSVEAALALEPTHGTLRRLKLELLVQKGDLPEAEAWLAPLLAEAPGDGRLLLQKAFLFQRLKRLSEATAAARAAMDDRALSDGDRRMARLTLVDLLLADQRSAEALAALEPLAAERSVAVLNRLGYARLGAGQAGEAAEAFRLGLPQCTTSDERRACAGGLRDAARKAGRLDLEITALQELVKVLPDPKPTYRDLGYALVKAGRDAEAYAAFRAALGPGAPSGAWLDAAYAAKRSGLNREAVASFAQGLEARLAEPAPDPVQAFGIRREAETLSRHFGAVLGSSYRQGGLLPGLTTSQKVMQQGAELYWQPEALTRDGRLAQVFVQGFETLWSGNQGPTGAETLQASAGVRVKPLSSQNLVLTAQRLFKTGDYAMQDWLLRAGYSADEGSDLRPWASHWTSWMVYTEGARFVEAKRYVHGLEARWGHSWRGETLPRLVVTPHLVLGADYDSFEALKTAAGLGAGLSLRQWFRQSRTLAPASWVDLSVQYRVKLTEAERGKGWFVRLTVWF